MKKGSFGRAVGVLDTGLERVRLGGWTWDCVQGYKVVQGIGRVSRSIHSYPVCVLSAASSCP